MKLQYIDHTEVPKVNQSSRYIPLVTEFFQSGQEAARVHLDEEVKVTCTAGYLRKIVKELGFQGQVRVTVRGGSIYMLRLERDQQAG